MRPLPTLYYDAPACNNGNNDVHYLTQFSAPDPFWLLVLPDGHKVAILNALETERARAQSVINEIIGLETVIAQLSTKTDLTANTGLWLLKKFKLKKIQIAHNFSAKLYHDLLACGIKIEFCASQQLPARQIKSGKEAQYIREANTTAAAGFAAAEAALRQTTIRGKQLYFKNKKFTSEQLLQIIENTCWNAGGVAMGTIAAGGIQACDPHHHGSGPLRAHELIVIDIFPKSRTSGYYGDMSRTFLKGTPSDAQAKLVKTVKEAQKLAVKNLRANVRGSEIHGKVVDYFNAKGYKTERKNDRWVGFFHGTGHGVGLDLHEAPRVSKSDNLLPENCVVTIEPGLYYPDIGGVRIEDVFYVQDKGAEALSSYPYDWILS